METDVLSVGDDDEKEISGSKANNQIIISVESRKGGVGKTTAALNLARILVEQGNPVLLIDADVTGTNVLNGIQNSHFWRNLFEPVTLNQSPVNLVEIFCNEYLRGYCLPDLIFGSSESKFNVIGSELFFDGQRNRGNRQDKRDCCNSNLICDPRILFDELHSMWLLSFIQDVCKMFLKKKGGEKNYVVIDNSPGYIGLAGSIHEWLTDIGPQQGKFLTVVSEDYQDIKMGIEAVEAIHCMMKEKIKGYTHCVSGNENLSAEAKKFFLRKLNGDRALKTRYWEKLKDRPGLQLEAHSYQRVLLNKIQLGRFLVEDSADFTIQNLDEGLSDFFMVAGLQRCLTRPVPFTVEVLNQFVRLAPEEIKRERDLTKSFLDISRMYKNPPAFEFMKSECERVLSAVQADVKLRVFGIWRGLIDDFLKNIRNNAVSWSGMPDQELERCATEILRLIKGQNNSSGVQQQRSLECLHSLLEAIKLAGDKIGISRSKNIRLRCMVSLYYMVGEECARRSEGTWSRNHNRGMFYFPREVEVMANCLGTVVSEIYSNLNWKICEQDPWTHLRGCYSAFNKFFSHLFYMLDDMKIARDFLEHFCAGDMNDIIRKYEYEKQLRNVLRNRIPYNTSMFTPLEGKVRTMKIFDAAVADVVDGWENE